MNLVALAAVVAAWLTGHGIPTPPVPITQVARLEIPAVTTGAKPVRAAGAYYGPDQGIRVDKDWDMSVLLHEELHAASDHAGNGAVYAGPGLAIEEGTVEAAARDLLAAAENRLTPLTSTAYVCPCAYDPQVWWIRAQSMAACGDDWRSRCARLWRRRLITGDRTGMLAAAAVVPELPQDGTP